MIKQSLAWTVLAVSLAGVHSAALAATPKDTVAAFHDALTSGDKDTALALLSPAVAIYEAGYVERSRDEYAHHHLGGKPVHAFGTGTMVLEKKGDGWTIVHVHWSSRKAK